MNQESVFIRGLKWLRLNAALVNGKPKATASGYGCHAVAFGLPLNDPNSTALGITIAVGGLQAEPHAGKVHGLFPDSLTGIGKLIRGLAATQGGILTATRIRP